MQNVPLEIVTAFPHRSNMIGISGMYGLFAILVAIGTNSLFIGLICFLPSVFCALIWIAAEHSRPTRIVIDPAKNEVSVQYRSWSMKQCRIWPLDKWQSVQSYVRDGLTNIVALRTSDQDFEILAISEFPLETEAKSRLSLPYPVENSEATELRKLIGATGVFEDRGFSATEVAGRYVG